MAISAPQVMPNGHKVVRQGDDLARRRRYRRFYHTRGHSLHLDRRYGMARARQNGPARIGHLSFRRLAISVALVCSEFKRRPYSLHLMHGLFTFMFFGVAALAQFLCRRFPFSDFYPVTFSDAEVVWTNAIVTVWLVTYYLGHRLTRHRPGGVKGHPLVVTQLGLFVGALLSVLALAFLAARGSFGVLTRGGFDEVVGVGSGTSHW